MSNDTRRWPAAREAALRQMLAKGCSRPKIAEALGVTLLAPLGKMQRLGLKGQRGDAYEAAIRRAADRGKT